MASVPETTPQNVCETPTQCVRQAEAWIHNRPDRAAAHLRQCVQCETMTPWAYHLLANVLLAQNAPQEALQTLRAGTRRFPSNAQTWRTLGRVAMSHNHSQEALLAYRKATELLPYDNALAEEYRAARAQAQNPETRLEVAIEPLMDEASVYLSSQDFERALASLDAALNVAKPVPKLRATVRHQIALVLIASGKSKAALRPLEKGLSEAVHPDALRAALLVSYADVLLAHDRADEALIAAAAATHITPENPLAWADLAIARLLSNDTRGGVKAFKKAFKAGLAQHITRKQLLEIGAVAKIEKRRDFKRMLDRAWPNPSRAR